MISKSEVAMAEGTIAAKYYLESLYYDTELQEVDSKYLNAARSYFIRQLPIQQSRTINRSRLRISMPV